MFLLDLLKDSHFLHLNIPDVLVAEIDTMIKKGLYDNRTKAIVGCIRNTTEIMKIKDQIKDAEFAKHIKDNWTEEKILPYMNSLSDEEINVLAMAIDTRKRT